MSKMDRRAFLSGLGGAALGVAVGGLSSVQTAHAGNKPLNFVFILIDDMGWKDLGCYGSGFYETPNIDALAAQGVRFTNAYAACCVCSPTRASILTGKYPARLHITDWIPGRREPKAKLKTPDFRQELPLEEKTIATVLKRAGYATASIGKWHLGKSPFDPQHHGFDINFAGDERGHPNSYFYPYNGPNVESGQPGEYLPDRLTDEALRFIEQNKDRPFLLYLPHYSVHAPFQAKPDMVRKYQDRVRPDDPQNSAVYGAMVESVDQSVGRVMDKLNELGIADQTVVFFMSDNGGFLRATSNEPWRSGKGTLYEGGLLVPLIVRWPDAVNPGTVSDVPVSSIDFFPTMIEMAGVSTTVKDVDGKSLVPLLKHGLPPERTALYWHYPHYHQPPAAPSGAIRKGDYKLIEFYHVCDGETPLCGRVELYNLKDDPAERRDLVATMPDKAAELQQQFHRWLKDVDAQMPCPNPDYKAPATGA